jgi:predicted ArsR family transcriptional regulator
MKTRKTSIEALRQVDFGAMQQEVLMALRILGDGCISDVASYLDMERSTISARMNELKEKGCIVFTSKKKSSGTGIMSEHYRVRQVDEPLRVAAHQPVESSVSQAARILAAAKGTKQDRRFNTPMLFEN